MTQIRWSPSEPTSSARRQQDMPKPRPQLFQPLKNVYEDSFDCSRPVAQALDLALNQAPPFSQLISAQPFKLVAFESRFTFIVYPQNQITQLTPVPARPQ